MWPKYLDLEPQDCPGILRRLELEAFSGVVSALRAQGELTKERRKVLNDLSNVLNISVERQKTEIRRAVNDEFLATVAKTLNGPHCETDWAREGRRIIPLLRRAMPITAFTPAADKVKSEIEEQNRILRAPASTRTPTVRRRRRMPRDEFMAPPKLSDMVENNVVVPPRVSLSKMSKSPQSADGDLVVLPSGMVVRVKPPADDPNTSHVNARTQRRKRNAPLSNSGAEENAVGSFEVYPPSPLGAMAKNSPMLAQAFQQGGQKRRRLSKGQSQASNAISQAGHAYSRPSQAPVVVNQMDDTLVTAEAATKHCGDSASGRLSRNPRTSSDKPQRSSSTPGGSYADPQQMLMPPPKSTVTPTKPAILQPPKVALSLTPKVSTPPHATSVAMTLTQGVRMFPAGTKILPKPESTGPSSSAATGTSTIAPNSVSGSGTAILASANPGTVGAPVYMLTGGQQNVMRVTRASPASGVALTTPTKMVTKPLAKNNPGALHVRPQLTTMATNARPSVIVVQRAAKPGADGQRILQTKDGKPVMIVSRPAKPIVSSPTSATPAADGVLPSSTSTGSAPDGPATKAVSQQGQTGNVIVLDLSQEQYTRTNVLHDILQASGIYSKESSEQSSASAAEAPRVGEETQNHPVQTASAQIKAEENGEHTSSVDNSRASNHVEAIDFIKDGIGSCLKPGESSLASSNDVHDNVRDNGVGDNERSVSGSLSLAQAHEEVENASVIPEPLKEAVENVSTPLERNVKDERLNSSTVHDQDAVEVATAMAAMADSVAKGSGD